MSVQVNIVLFVFTVSKYFCLPLPHPVFSFMLKFSALSVEAHKELIQHSAQLTAWKPSGKEETERPGTYSLGCRHNKQPLSYKFTRRKGVETPGQNILDRRKIICRRSGRTGNSCQFNTIQVHNNKTIYSWICCIALAGMHLLCEYPKLWCV